MKEILYLLNLLISNNIDISLNILNNKEFVDNLTIVLQNFINNYQVKTINYSDSSMNLDIAKEKTKIILKKIFYSYNSYKLDKFIDNTVIIESEIFDSGTNYSIMYVSDEHNLLTVPAMTHEVTHKIVLEHLNLKKFKSEYFEMFSMLLDKISSYIMGNEYYEANKTYRSIDLYNKAKSFLECDSRNIPDNNKYLIKLFSLQTIIGEIYSTILFNEYLKDPEMFICILNYLFNDQISLNNFLDSFKLQFNTNSKDKISLLLN